MTLISGFEWIESDLAVAGHLSVAHIAQAKRLGFASVICNRPDEEADADQASFADIARACRAEGIEAFYLPVPPAGHTDQQALQMVALLTSSPRPILAYCRSGARTRKLIALGEHLSVSSQIKDAA
ncbi:MAG: TIGR01244 family phosphatase [Burkholderiaceae bacterium]|nr:TIGR01244 family phosphatase [Burkholderiaceae bacterium]